jgi:hypothetical protein
MLTHTPTHYQKTHAHTHTVAHTQGICVSICRTIYPSIYLALIVSVYSCIYSSLCPSIHLPTLFSIYLSGVATMRGCVATRIELLPRRAAVECSAGRDGNVRPRRCPRLRPIRWPSAPEYPLSTLRSSRPPSASPWVRESAAARATPVQQREPERTALRPARPT